MISIEDTSDDDSFEEIVKELKLKLAISDRLKSDHSRMKSYKNSFEEIDELLKKLSIRIEDQLLFNTFNSNVNDDHCDEAENEYDEIDEEEVIDSHWLQLEDHLEVVENEIPNNDQQKPENNENINGSNDASDGDKLTEELSNASINDDDTTSGDFTTQSNETDTITITSIDTNNNMQTNSIDESNQSSSSSTTSKSTSTSTSTTSTSKSTCNNKKRISKPKPNPNTKELRKVTKLVNSSRTKCNDLLLKMDLLNDDLNDVFKRIDNDLRIQCINVFLETETVSDQIEEATGMILPLIRSSQWFQVVKAQQSQQS